jgi:hypothetical protein
MFVHLCTHTPSIRHIVYTCLPLYVRLAYWCLFVYSVVEMWSYLLPWLFGYSSGQSLSKLEDGFQLFWVLFCGFLVLFVVVNAAFAFGVF